MKFCLPLTFNPAPHLAALTRAAEDAGFSGVILSAYGVGSDDLQKKCDAVRRFGDEVIARMPQSK